MSRLIGTTIMDSMFRGADTGVSDGGASTDVGNAQVDQTQSGEVNGEATVNVEEPKQPEPISEIEIDGFGKVKFDEIKEWKNGYMRQSDYTKKTQEIAKLKQENKEAHELYSYLKANPEIARALSEGDMSGIRGNESFQGLNPVNSQIQDLNMKLASYELDNNINNLKTRYPDFNEVEVLTEADRLGVTDLEFVYNALQGKKIPELKQTLQREIEKSITEKIRKNGLDTQSIINANDSTSSNSIGLSDAEVAIARKMGMTPEEYNKGKNIKL